MRKLIVEKLEPRTLLALFDGITDLIANPTHVTQQGGHWENPATWEGFDVPGLDDVALIKDEHFVVAVNGPSIDAKGIGVKGFMFTWNNSISVKDWLVYEGGTLINGPGSRTTFKDLPANDPGQFGTGLIVLGTWYAWGDYKTPYVRTTADIQQGQSSIELADAPDNWNPNDNLVIPETNQTRAFAGQPRQTLQQSEVIKLEQINGNNLSLQRPTNHSHPGMSANPWNEERYSHIANISRTTFFRSAGGSVTEGHVIVAGPTASAFVSSVGFYSLGRTSGWDPTGPNNLPGRYPVHLHKLREEGQNVVLQDSVVVWGQPKWGITIHSTNNAVVKNNIVYASVGAGIATEDASESGNLIEGNLVINVYGGWQTGDVRAGAHDFFNGNVQTGNEGSGFWFRGPANIVQGNFVYDAAGYAYNYNGYYTNSDSTVPENKIRPVNVFRDNEAVSSFGGLWLSWSQACCDIHEFQPSLFEDFTAWNVSHKAVKAYHESNNTFRNVLIVGDPAVSSSNEGSPSRLETRTASGFDFGFPNYENFFTSVVGARVSGLNIGFLGSPNPGPTGMRIRDSVFANYVNIGFEQGARHAWTIYDNVEFLMTEVERINWPLYPICQADIWDHRLVVDPGVCN